MSQFVTINSNNKFITKSNLGGKAFHLIKMHKNELPIPAFFVIPFKTVHQLLNKTNHLVEDICNVIDFDNISSVRKLSNKIMTEIIDLSISKSFKEELNKQFSKIFSNETLLAVRSSAIDEDTNNTSFAGQHHTSLFVNQDNLLRQILKVIASVWSTNALIYRHKNKIDFNNIKISVIIQKMINAQKSGICFSMNPSGNLADSIVVSTYGLGEGIVNDKVTTDSYFINRNTAKINVKYAKKTNALVYQNNCIKLIKVEKKLQNLPCLSNNEILKIQKFSLIAENLLNKPADIEFCFNNLGELFLVQMRAITTISLSKIKMLDNTNIVESYPDITLPLSFSFAKQAYEKVFIGSANAFLMSKKTQEKNAKIFKHLIAHPYGRIYYRLDNWYKMIGLITSSNKFVKHWENAVGLQIETSNLVKIGFRSKFKSYVAVIKLLLGFNRLSKKFFKSFDTNIVPLKKCITNYENASDLWLQYEKASTNLFKPWYLTIINDFLAFKSFAWLQNLIKQYNISQNIEFANNLLCGLGNTKSESALLKTLDLKEKIKNNIELSKLFENKPTEILKELKQDKHIKFYNEIQIYLELYGDRTLAELKLETTTLRKTPIKFISLLQKLTSSSLTVIQYKTNQDKIQNEAIAIVNKKFSKLNYKKHLLKYVIKLAYKGLQNRENMRFARTRAYGAVKEIFLEIGYLMQQKKCIENATDVFYLNINILKDFCLNSNYFNRDEEINILKEKYKEYETLNLPSQIIYQNNDLPLFQNFIKSKNNDDKQLIGTVVSSGIIEAEAVVVLRPNWNLNIKNKILVTKMTDPGWVFLMVQAVGLISEKGSLLSHTAIVGRELNIPVIVGVENATSQIKTGDWLRIDGQKGTIKIIKTKKQMALT